MYSLNRGAGSFHKTPVHQNKVRLLLITNTGIFFFQSEISLYPEYHISLAHLDRVKTRKRVIGLCRARTKTPQSSTFRYHIVNRPFTDWQ